MGAVARCAILVALGTGLLTGSTVLSETADVQIVIEFPSNQPTSFEYGAPWVFQAVAQWTYSGSPADTTSTITVRRSGTTTPFPATTYIYADASSRTTTATFVPAFGTDPLAVGEYAVDADFQSNFLGGEYSGTSTTPYVFSITPAKVAIELKVLPDPEGADGAVLSADMVGDFVDTVARGNSQASLPAGTWNFAIVTASGDVVEERHLRQGAGGSPMVSFEWTDIPANLNYFIADFTPETNSGNFDFLESSRAPFVGPTNTPTPSVVPSPTMAVGGGSQNSGGPLLSPPWIVGVVTLILAILGVAIATLVIRSRKARAKTLRAVDLADRDQ